MNIELRGARLRFEEVGIEVGEVIIELRVLSCERWW